MIGQKLAIEQLKAAYPHPRHQPDQRHFRCVGRPREHALAKKSAAHRQTIKPADQFIALPTFDAVCHPQAVQRQKRIFDIAVDPRLASIILIFRTFCNDLRKGRVAGHAKAILPDHLGKRLADP